MPMIRMQPVSRSPAITRLASLSPLRDEDVAALENAECKARKFQARREIFSEGEPIPEPRILLSGWACRTHTLSDGRRQIISLILPGDLIGMSWHRSARATYSVTPLTEVVLYPAPPAYPGTNQGSLAEAFALSKAQEDTYLMRHVTRLGRMSAYERLADLLLEIFGRLASAGLTHGNSFQMPLTQETLADMLGLTNVHVNRTIQTLRHNGVLTLESRRVDLHDITALAGVFNARRTGVGTP